LINQKGNRRQKMTEEKDKAPKKVDIEGIEDVARDIIETTDMPDIDNIDLPEHLKEQLMDAGFSELDELEKELGIDGGHFLSSSDKGLDTQGVEQEETCECGQDKDGEFEISLDEDQMSVTIDLYPSMGKGVPLTYERVKAKLDALNVVFGVNYDLLTKLVEKGEKTGGEKTGIVIARGKVPEEGEDGRIEFKFSESDAIFREE